MTTIPDNTYFRLRAVTFDNVPWVATMKKNEHYFPTSEFKKEDGAWVKKVFGEEGGVGAEVMDEGEDDGANPAEQ